MEITELRRKAGSNKSNPGNKSKKARQKRSRNKDPNSNEIAGDQPPGNKAKTNQRQVLSQEKPVETSNNITGNIKSQDNSKKPSSNKNQTGDRSISQSDNNNYNKNNNNSKTNPQRDMNKERKTKSKIILAGDSMIKNIKGWGLKKRMNQNDEVYVHSFPGATVTDMHSYCKTVNEPII